MTNEYFNHDTNRFVPGSTTRAGSVNDRFDAVALGFEELPPPDTLKAGTFNYGVDDTHTNNYEIQTPVMFGSYADGMEIKAKIAHGNTGMATINVDSLGAVEIQRTDRTVLANGDIADNSILVLQYDADANVFLIISALSSIVDAAATSALEAQAWAQQANPTGVILMQQNVISTDILIAPAGHNSMSIGPITIAANVIVTVGTGSNWVIL